MNHLTNMKMSKEKAKTEHMCEPESGPRFPHGLRVELNDDSLAKLGMTTLPTVGEEMIVVGIGKVTNVSQHDSGNNKSRNVSIQLEKMEVGPTTEKTAVDAVTDAIKDA